MRMLVLLLAALVAWPLAGWAAEGAAPPPVSLDALLTVLIPAVLTPLALIATEQLKAWMPALLSYTLAKWLVPGVLYAAAVWLGTLAEVYALPGWAHLVIAPLPNILYTALRATGWAPPSKLPAPVGTVPVVLLAALLAAGCATTPVPKSFDQSAAYAQATITSVRDTAHDLLVRQRITPDRAERINADADEAKRHLDTARALAKEGKPDDALATLRLARAILDRLEAELAGIQPRSEAPPAPIPWLLTEGLYA